MQSLTIALFIGFWTLLLLSCGAEPNPWLSVRRAGNSHELTYRSRSRRIRYTAAWSGGQRYRSLEVLSI
jgi:hypothetical protein